RGMPYGTHATAPLAIGSPFAAASASAFLRASNGPAYCGFMTIAVAGGGARGSACPELVEGRPPRYGAHTPDRSGDCADAVAEASRIAAAANDLIDVLRRLRPDRSSGSGRPAS